MKQTVRLNDQDVMNALVLYLATKGLQADNISLETHTDFLGRRTHTYVCRGVSSREPYIFMKKSSLENLKQKLVNYKQKETIQKAAKLSKERLMEKYKKNSIKDVEL